MKSLQISLEDAKKLLEKMPELAESIYATYPELKPKSIVPDSWSDLKEIEGYFIGSHSSIMYGSSDPDRRLRKKNDGCEHLFATQQQAESALAYAQLTQLMKATGDCEDIDWNDLNETKYVVVLHKNAIEVKTAYQWHQFLAFKTKAIAEEFLEKHKTLIEQFHQM